jgi:asparagine synthase (glutamine-hydrolysing)
VSGLSGIIARTPSASLATSLQRLLGPVHSRGAFRVEQQVDPGGSWALARTHLGLLQPSAQLTTVGDLRVMFHGNLDNGRELTPLHDRTDAPPTAVDIVGALYQQNPAGFCSQLRGDWSAVVHDLRGRRTLLVSDLLGSHPVYWTVTDAGFWFGPTVEGVLRSAGLERRVDAAAVADYLAYGMVFGTKTLARNIFLVPPASVLHYDWASGAIVTTEYRRIADAFKPWSGSRNEFLEALRARFNAAVGRAAAGPARPGLSLSGGLDSRAILSAIPDASTLHTYTLGVRGCADEVIASALSRQGRTRHRFLPLDESYLGEFLPNLRRMVGLTDGLYLTHGLTEILALGALDEREFDVLLRGHCGELAKASLAWPFHTDAQIHAMTRTPQFLDYFYGRVNYISRDVSLRDLFEPEWARQMDGQARASLEDSIRNVDLQPADLCSYVYLREHHRRFTIPSLDLFRTRVEVRLPFADEEFLALLFQAPPSWRDDTAIHRHITGRNAPRLLKVRNSNTGAPGDAGPMLERVMDPVNTILKRLGVRGYRHYHSFDRWMHQQLLSSVEAVLLDPVARSRGMLREAALRRIIGEERSGSGRHAYLLQVLLILELWQRTDEPVTTIGSGHQ